MHQVVTAQLAARRSGTQSTKTRAEVRGGGKKPFKQKGTGNARQGSTRAPHYSGGGVALGPKPRKYDQKTPQEDDPRRPPLGPVRPGGRRADHRRRRLGLRRSQDHGRRQGAAGARLGSRRTVLVVVGPEDENTILSFRNIPNVQLIEAAELNAYDVLCNDWIVFTRRQPARLRHGRAEPQPTAADEPQEATSMKDPRDVIIEPIVSEKSYALIEQGVYTFQVHTSATKPEIHDAVERHLGRRRGQGQHPQPQGQDPAGPQEQPRRPPARHQACARHPGRRPARSRCSRT